jgi:hypothetical protein
MSPNFDTYERDHWSALLYVETCVVDHGGVTDHRKLNESDMDALSGMDADGLVIWRGTGLNPVFSLTDAGWAVAHMLRRHRAEHGEPRDRASLAADAFAGAWRGTGGS